MSKSILLWLIGWGAVVNGSAAAQNLDGPARTFRDSLVDRLAGEWRMAGAIRGQPANYSLHAEWVLNHQFLRLDLRDVATPPAYQATVYLGSDHTSERYVAHWIDAFGGRVSETLGYAVPSPGRLALVFEYPDGPFHTTFTWRANEGTWGVLMEQRGARGAWQEFAHYTLTK